MPDGVIDTVEQMAKEEGQAPVGRENPYFKWSPGIVMGDGPGQPILPEQGAAAPEDAPEDGVINHDEGPDESDHGENQD